MPNISKRSPTKSGGFVGHGGFVPAPPKPRIKTGKTYPYASAKRGVLPPGMAAAILDPQDRKDAARAIYDKLRSRRDDT